MEVKILLYMEEIFKMLSNLIWGNWLLAALLLVGLYFTILTGFIQFRWFKLSMKEVWGSRKSDNTKGEGTLSPYEALCTALSSCIGNGNIVGVATAIVLGGPGAVFWMWVAGILGMATKYAEIVLGMIYREKLKDGSFVGGPMYYLSKGLNMKKTGVLFAVLMFLQISGGALIQSNAIALVAKDIFHIKPLISGIIMLILVSLVIVGGVKRLGFVSTKIVPIMALIYFIGSLIIIITNFHNIIPAITMIFESAFNFNSVGGGVAGYSIRTAMRFGIARGLYSNEAGEGSAPVLHSTAITDHPSRQGLFGIVEVFIDTIIMCSLTSFVIITTGIYTADISPALMVMRAFESIHPIFKYVIGISMILFGFSSILAQWYFGDVTLTFILDKKRAGYFKFIFVFLSLIGPLVSLHLVWYIQDTILGIMIIPNLLAILLLSIEVKKSAKDFSTNYINI